MRKHIPYQRIRGVKRDDQIALDRAKDAKAYAEYLLSRAPLASLLLERIAKIDGRVSVWVEGAHVLRRPYEVVRTERFISIRFRLSNGGVLGTGVSTSEIAGADYGFDEIEAAVSAAVRAIELRLEYGLRYQA